MNVKLPFTENETIYSYSGAINVGSSPEDIRIDINNESMVITASLPEPGILSHEIDNERFEYYDKKTGVFSRYNMGDFNEAQKKSKA